MSKKLTKLPYGLTELPYGPLNGKPLSITARRATEHLLTRLRKDYDPERDGYHNPRNWLNGVNTRLALDDLQRDALGLSRRRVRVLFPVYTKAMRREAERIERRHASRITKRKSK